MPLPAGTRPGPYEITGSIGAGGMGEVYRARDTRLDRTVAVKVLPRAAAADPMFRERFEREARSLSALNHPNICTVHDVGRHDDVNYLVMEHLEGLTLAAILEQGAMPSGEAFRLAAQIADALVVAHRHGIIHRDLKPANVMIVGGRGTPPMATAKLVDFGARFWVHSSTWRPNRSRGARRTHARTSGRSAACCMRCSRAGARSRSDCRGGAPFTGVG